MALPKPRNDFGRQMNPTGFDLTIPEREHLEEGHALLHLTASVDVLLHQSAISRSMATISFSTCWMSASISSSGRGGRYS